MADPHTILGIGRPTIEMLGTLRRLPQPGGAQEIQQFSIQGSGSASTALMALLEWGYRCRYMGKTSDDTFGAMIQSQLDFEGFDASGLVVSPGHVSPFSFVALAEAERMDRTVLFTPGNVPPLTRDEVDPGQLDGCSALLVDGSEPDAQILLAEAARERDIPVVFDASRPGERDEELIALSRVLIASERFVAEVAPREKQRDSLEALRKRGPDIAIITMGIEGAIGLHEQSEVLQPIFSEITPRERGGTGYHFFAGVVHGLLQGWKLDRMLRFASAAAGLSCREIGSIGGTAALSEVEETAWPNEG